MKRIEIKYQPIKYINWQLTARGSHPTNWGEVTPQQIIAIACATKGTLSDIGFLHSLTGIKKHILKKLDDYQRFMLSESFTFLSDSKIHNAIILQELTVKLKTFRAPKPRLKGMTFGQFIFVDSHFGSYHDTSNKNELHNFLAALYLPNRRKFSEENIEINAPLLAQLNSKTKEAVIINYMLIKEWLTKTYPLVFLKPDSNDELKDNAGKQQYDPMAWAKIFENIVGDNIADREKYAKLPVHTAFRYISKKIKENIKRKK